MKRTVATYSLAALAAFFLFGCRSSTEPSSNNSGSVTVVHPGIGSSYTYHTTSKDSNGTVTNDGDYTETVIGANVSFGGRTDAIEMINDGAATDTSYYAIQSNGDILLYMGDPTGESNQQLWVKLPFSGGAGQSVTVIDTTGDLLGLGVPIHLVAGITTTAAGSESVTTAGKTFNARKAKMTINTTMTVANQSSSSSIVQNIWMAPEIGNLIKMEQPSYRDALSSQTMDSQLDILTAYSLK